MPADGVRIGWCDQLLMPQSHQNFHPGSSCEIAKIM
jgi:hypothetical protein